MDYSLSVPIWLGFWNFYFNLSGENMSVILQIYGG